MSFESVNCWVCNDTATTCPETHGISAGHTSAQIYCLRAQGWQKAKSSRYWYCPSHICYVQHPPNHDLCKWYCDPDCWARHICGEPPQPAPGASAAPGSSGEGRKWNQHEATANSLVGSLIAQMRQDIIAGMNAKDRAQKFKTFYMTRLHPDKWGGWNDMSSVMTEVFKRLKSEEAKYLDGTM